MLGLLRASKGIAGPYPVLGQEAEQRASQSLVAVEGAVVRPDSGRCHEVVARSFRGRIGF